MSVNNVTSQCAYAGNPILAAPVDLLVVHHCSLSTDADGNDPIADDLLTGPALAWRFANHGLGTGGLLPYHALVTRSARIDQMLPLSREGMHAREYNRRSLAVVTAGEHGITPQMYWALVRCLAAWVVWTSGAIIRGHTQLPDASADPHKVCPHPSLDMDALVSDVAGRLNQHNAGWRAFSEDERLSVMTAEGWQIT
jgi:N-acetylmuramoyl-L-alanine amidase